MQVKANYSAGELQEAARLMRSSTFWLKFAGANWYASAIVLVAVVLAVDAIVKHEEVKWSGVGVLLALAAFRFGLSWVRMQSRLKAAAKKTADATGTRTLESGGIRTTMDSGASSFVPWSSYNKWVEGKSVFVVTGAGTTTPAILPVDDGNRDAMRGFLQSHVA